MGFSTAGLPDSTHMSEAWSPLTTDEVTSEFTPAEMNALNNIQASAGSLAQICTRVTELIRKAYTDGGRELGDAGTVPEGEKTRAIALARWRLLISFPALKSMQTPERKKAAEDAEAWWMQIAKRELKGTGGAEIAVARERKRTPAKLNGL